jgi:hypothetical protein
LTTQQEQQDTRSEIFINVRKLAALDMALHNHWLILAEFSFGVVACGVLGADSLYTFFSHANSPFFLLLIGIVLAWIMLNYIPMLLYVISIMRRKSALQEATFESSHRVHSMHRYSIQSLFLVLPLIIPLLAIYQEIGAATQRKKKVV